MKSLSTRVIVAFACVYFFWGSTYVAMRFGVEVLPPFVLGSARYLIAGPLMLGLCAARGMSLRVSRRELGILAAIGVLMLGMGNTGVLWAEQYLPSGLTALLVAVIPIYVALIETMLPGGEGLRLRGWVGIAAGFAGLVVLVSPGLREGLGTGLHGKGSGQLAGSAVAILAALAWTFGTLLQRHGRLTVKPFVGAAWQMLFGGIFNLGLMLLHGDSYRRVWPAQAVWSIAWLVTFGSLVGYTAYIYLLEHVPVAKVSTYAYINPIVAVLLGGIFLGERLVPIEYVGMAAILVAVYLVTSSKLRSAAVTRPELASEAAPVSE